MLAAAVAMVVRSSKDAAGGPMSYATNLAESERRTAAYVDKTLRGAKPAELPIELPTCFEFVINLKTAAALGVTPSQGAAADC